MVVLLGSCSKRRLSVGTITESKDNKNNVRLQMTKAKEAHLARGVDMVESEK